MLALCPLLAAFAPLGSSPLAAERLSPPRMVSAANVARKATVVDEVKQTLQDTALMFCVRSEGISVNNMNAARKMMPDETVVRCVKNTLIERAIADDDRFPKSEELLMYSNYWFFVPETEVRSTVEAWEKFIKDRKLVRPVSPP